MTKCACAGPTETLEQFRARRALADKRYSQTQLRTQSKTVLAAQAERAARRKAEWDSVEQEILARESGAAAKPAATAKSQKRRVVEPVAVETVEQQSERAAAPATVPRSPSAGQSDAALIGTDKTEQPAKAEKAEKVEEKEFGIQDVLHFLRFDRCCFTRVLLYCAYCDVVQQSRGPGRLQRLERIPSQRLSGNALLLAVGFLGIKVILTCAADSGDVCFQPPNVRSGLCPLQTGKLDLILPVVVC